MTEIVPHGYISAREAVDRLGRELFSSEWTGEEYKARRGLISENEWLKIKDLAPARGGGAPGSAPGPTTIIAPAATAPHQTGDPSTSSYQAEYRARKQYENACKRLRAKLEAGELEAAILDAFKGKGKLHRASTALWRQHDADRMIEKGRAPIPYSRRQGISCAEPAPHAATRVKNPGSGRCLAGKISDKKSNTGPAKGFRAPEVPEVPGDCASIWRDISGSSSANRKTEKV